jgi:hypothetical protein
MTDGQTDGYLLLIVARKLTNKHLLIVILSKIKIMTESLPIPPRPAGVGSILAEQQELVASIAAATRALQEESEALQREVASLQRAQEEVRADAEEWNAGQKGLEDARDMLSMRKEDLAQLQVWIL